jgi:hypothetical protein
VARSACSHNHFSTHAILIIIVVFMQFNTPVQLGPRSTTKPTDAQIITIPVQADDILILATDGLSDNLWDDEVLDEVVRFRRAFLKPRLDDANASMHEGLADGLLGRRTLAGMLSEALCSRARRVSERGHGAMKSSCLPKGNAASGETEESFEMMDGEVPFARRARENGRSFRGGKTDGECQTAIAQVESAELSFQTSASLSQ